MVPKRGTGLLFLYNLFIGVISLHLCKPALAIVCVQHTYRITENLEKYMYIDGMNNDSHVMDGITLWTEVKALIEAKAPVRDISETLSKLTKLQIQETYEESKNLLHIAIASQYPEVVELLFQKHFFKQPHQSTTVPYLHMACVIGCQDSVSILSRHRPDDIDTCVPVDDCVWNQFLAKYPFNGKCRSIPYC